MTDKNWIRYPVVIVGLLGFILGICHFLTRPSQSEREAERLLASLIKECDLYSPNNNYEFSNGPQPTEWARLKIIQQLKALGSSALSETIKLRDSRAGYDEAKEMLILISAALGDRGALAEASELVADSNYPAVRVCAARELRKLHDPSTKDALCRAMNDTLFYRGCACGEAKDGGWYPVRLLAWLALKDLGVSEIELESLDRHG
jgi:hypothetical protein